jgi:hypothetical protein
MQFGPGLEISGSLVEYLLAPGAALGPSFDSGHGFFSLLTAGPACSGDLQVAISITLPMQVAV